jgi:hypothetical protein
VDIFNLKKTRLVVPTMNIYIFDATQLLQDDLESSTFRNKAILPLIKVLILLRFFASGSFQIIIADIYVLINRESAFTTTCTLIEWYSFLFTHWSSCCEGAIIRTYVPSIRPKIFGKLPLS